MGFWRWFHAGFERGCCPLANDARIVGQGAYVISQHGVHFPFGCDKADPISTSIEKIGIKQECFRITFAGINWDKGRWCIAHA